MDFIGKCLLVEELEKRILVIGDLHIGYEENLNRSGVFVYRGMFKEMIVYLDRVFGKVGNVDEVVLLGDVKHVFGRILRQEWKDVLNLVDYLSERCGKIIIVRGNHDKIIKVIVGKGNVEVMDCYSVGENCFMHGDRKFPDALRKRIKRWIVGHGHPAVKISDGIKVEKYKCFLVGEFKRKEIVIVPSFFEGSIGSDYLENDLGMAWKFDLKNFNVWVVDDESVNYWGLKPPAS